MLSHMHTVNLSRLHLEEMNGKMLMYNPAALDIKLTLTGRLLVQSPCYIQLSLCVKIKDEIANKKF